MRILLAIDEKFPVDKEKLIKLLQLKAKFVEFELFSEKFTIDSGLMTKPKTFTDVDRQFHSVKNKYDIFFCLTLNQYDDNYFFHEHHNLVICSFYGWNYLTDLPLSNGILYFIIDYLALKINHTGFRHQEITGCIYDFLKDKRGVDDGMRQSRFCSNCLKRIPDTFVEETDFKIFDDLQILMNHLSDASRWNRDILITENLKTNSISKRKPKNSDDIIRVFIASPGDTDIERELLLNSLEVRFRRDNHEGHCGFRIMVNGWENLASQPGYPQDVINKIVDESDFVVAVFRHKLGTPTRDIISGEKREESGTVEELLQALDISNNNCPIGMAYFYSKAPSISLDNPKKEQIENEWKRLTEFKNLIKNKMIYKPFTEDGELISTVLMDLERNIMDYINKATSNNTLKPKHNRK